MDFNEEQINRLADQYNELINQIHEKGKYIDVTSQDSIEIVIQWYERLINDLIESQTQLIENIQHERDRARNELTKFESNIQHIHREIQQMNNIDVIHNQLNDLTQQISRYQITKDIYLPNSYTFQPRYRISYQFKQFEEEENWDIDQDPSSVIPKSTTAPLFSPDISQTFVMPKDEDADEWNDFQFHERLEENNPIDSEYFLDPKLYQFGPPRPFNMDIHLIASNGNDLLFVNDLQILLIYLSLSSRCYSRQTKQLIYSIDGDVNSTILQWYHGHLLQLVWFDHLKSFVTITENPRYEIYSIQCLTNLRLKIRLHTCLPAPADDLIKDRIYLRTDDEHLFIYYERTNGRKRLRLLNRMYECIRSYPIDQCLHKDDQGCVIGLGVNQDYVREIFSGLSLIFGFFY